MGDIALHPTSENGGCSFAPLFVQAAGSLTTIENRHINIEKR
jgi:hypothetical protein